MTPKNVSKAFQAELILLMNKYTGGQVNRKLSARERCRLAADFQVYLMMCATKVLIPAGTKNAIDSVILSNCKQYERLQRMVYKADPEPVPTTQGENSEINKNPQPQSETAVNS